MFPVVARLTGLCVCMSLGLGVGSWGGKLKSSNTNTLFCKDCSLAELGRERERKRERESLFSSCLSIITKVKECTLKLALKKTSFSFYRFSLP